MNRDNDIPRSDSLAGATRGALLRLAHTVPATRFSWAAVQMRARHVQRTRTLTAVATGLFVLASTTTAVAAVRSDGHRVSTPERESTTTTTRAPSTSMSTSTSLAPCADRMCGVGNGGAATAPTAPAGPPAPAQASDLEGTLVLDATTLVAADRMPYTLTVRNISDHTITFTSDSGVLGVWVDNVADVAPGSVGVFDFTLAPDETRSFSSWMWANQDMVGSPRVWAAIITTSSPDGGSTPSYITGVPPVPVTIVSADPVLPWNGKWTATMSADVTTARVGETVTVYATVRNVGNGRQATAGYSSLGISCSGANGFDSRNGEFINGEPFEIGEERTIPFAFLLYEELGSQVTCGFGLASHGDAFAARGLEIAPVTITVLPAEEPTTTTMTTSTSTSTTTTSP